MAWKTISTVSIPQLLEERHVKAVAKSLQKCNFGAAYARPVKEEIKDGSEGSPVNLLGGRTAMSSTQHFSWKHFSFVCPFPCSTGGKRAGQLHFAFPLNF